MTRVDSVIRTPGRPPTYVSPRDEGGWIFTQGKNRIWLGSDESTLLIAAITEGER